MTAAENPAVSIVLPTYNREHIIARAIDSALAQTFTDFELLVVDDGSTDNTAEIMRGYTDTRIHYLKQEKNQGGAEARNIGIRASKGRYIALLDSDDEWLPPKLEKQVAQMDALPEKTGVCYTGCHRIEPNHRSYAPANNVAVKEGDVFAQMLAGNFVAATTLLFRREAILAVEGFRKGMPRAQDWELLIRLAKRFHFSVVNEPLANSYLEADSISQNRQKFIAGYTIIHDSFLEDFEAHPVAHARILFNLGHAHVMEGNTAVGRPLLGKAASLVSSKQYTGAYRFSAFGSAVYRLVAGVVRKLR